MAPGEDPQELVQLYSPVTYVDLSYSVVVVNVTRDSKASRHDVDALLQATDCALHANPALLADATRSVNYGRL